jgi:hypothetical protein
MPQGKRDLLKMRRQQNEEEDEEDFDQYQEHDENRNIKQQEQKPVRKNGNGDQVKINPKINMKILFDD